MVRRTYSLWTLAAVLIVLSAILFAVQVHSGPSAPDLAESGETHAGFPAELVEFVPSPENPVFTAAGTGHWDAKIRERGWILREGGAYHLWYTGYDGTTEGVRQLGYATSPDGLRWTRWPGNPLCRDHWVEDMMVVKSGDTYYMFAEGLHDHAQLLTSKDRVNWKPEGTLDIRTTNNQPLSPGPFGTPTAWLENGTWYLFYERMDAGAWLAASHNLKVWTNLRDEPVIVPGPEPYDKDMIALNQIVKHRGQYFAFYHGSDGQQRPRLWSTNVARSRNLLDWEKYPHNPIVDTDKSSGIAVFDGRRFRLYTMHVQVDLYFPRDK